MLLRAPPGGSWRLCQPEEPLKSTRKIRVRKVKSFALPFILSSTCSLLFHCQDVSGPNNEHDEENSVGNKAMFSLAGVHRTWNPPEAVLGCACPQWNAALSVVVPPRPPPPWLGKGRK